MARMKTSGWEAASVADRLPKKKKEKKKWKSTPHLLPLPLPPQRRRPLHDAMIATTDQHAGAATTVRPVVHVGTNSDSPGGYIVVDLFPVPLADGSTRQALEYLPVRMAQSVPQFQHGRRGPRSPTTAAAAGGPLLATWHEPSRARCHRHWWRCGEPYLQLNLRRRDRLKRRRERKSHDDGQRQRQLGVDDESEAVVAVQTAAMAEAGTRTGSTTTNA